MAADSGTGHDTAQRCPNAMPHRHHDWIYNGVLCRCPGALPLPDPPVAVPGPADPVVSPADTPEWDYADVLDGPWYVDREPREKHRMAIKSGHFTILTVGDYFDGGGPLADRIEWLCRIVNERLLLVEGVSAVSGRWHGLYDGTANDQAMVNREALAALLAERVALLAAGERDRQQIARLTEALERIADASNDLPPLSAIVRAERESFREIARAVLAGEEDARP